MIKIQNHRSITIQLIYCILPLFFFACGNTETKTRQPEKAYLAVQMEWPVEATDRSSTSVKNICDDYGIDMISIIIQNAGGKSIGQNDLDCTEHKGTITNIPIGSGYTVLVKAFVSGNNDWEAIKEGVVVAEGKTNIRVNMEYKGEDQTPPGVIETIPPPSASGVALNTNIEIKFNEFLMHSSVNDTSVTIKNSSSTIASKIRHTPGSDTVFLSPSNVLESGTQYSVSVDRHISDCANNKMENSYTFSFTTTTSQNPLNPPAGLSGKSGNKMVWLNWEKVPEATGYNIYMSDSSTITTKPNGYLEVNPSQNTTYSWEGLQNNKTYYFLVTATDASKESDPTFTVNETPMLIPFESDLVAYYDFTNGSADDLSINANHGIAYDVQPAADRMGKSNRALYFNGKSSYIQIDNLSSWDPLKFTMIIIFKIFDYNDTYCILNKGVEKRNFATHIIEDPIKKAGFANYSHSFMNGSDIKTGYAKIYNFKIPFKKFGAVTFSLERNPKISAKKYRVISYYHTGKKYKVINAAEPLFDNSPLIIGANDNQMRSEFFKGVIDDVIIYNRVLKDKEISKLYKFLLPAFTTANIDSNQPEQKTFFNDTLKEKDQRFEEMIEVNNPYHPPHYHCPDHPFCE